MSAVELNLGRMGTYFSDRLVVCKSGLSVSGIKVDQTKMGWLLRIVSWIFNPNTYSDENRRTIACVKKYLLDQLGEQRLSRICQRYDLNLDHMEKKGYSLLSRDLAKIMTGIHDVKIEDIEELIAFSKKELSDWPSYLSTDVREILRTVNTSEELNGEAFTWVQKELAHEQRGVSLLATLPPLPKKISGGAPSRSGARFFSDRLLADRERLEICKENPEDSFETFVQNLVVRGIAREPQVGTLIQAPNHQNGTPQFYRVSAKIITGGGMVSFILLPAHRDSDLKPIRFYRGTAMSPSSIDMSSTIITDGQEELGRSAYNSGKIYEAAIKRHLGPIPIAAGHSLGSTTLQYALVENADLKEAYLFNGPGIPISDVEKFNQRLSTPDCQPLLLHIRDSHTDVCCSLGQVHIGYQAPEDKVQIDYQKIFPQVLYKVIDGILGETEPRFTVIKKLATGAVHVLVPERESRIYGIEGGLDRLEIDAKLNRHQLKESLERTRRILGPLISKIVLLLRSIFRTFFGSRTKNETGLHIGRFEQNQWVVTHVKPREVSEKNRL